jgi:hypothetical protein
MTRTESHLTSSSLSTPRSGGGQQLQHVHPGGAVAFAQVGLDSHFSFYLNALSCAGAIPDAGAAVRAGGDDLGAIEGTDTVHRCPPLVRVGTARRLATVDRLSLKLCRRWTPRALLHVDELGFLAHRYSFAKKAAAEVRIT